MAPGKVDGQHRLKSLGSRDCVVPLVHYVEQYENFALVLGGAGASSHASSTRDGVRLLPGYEGEPLVSWHCGKEWRKVPFLLGVTFRGLSM